MDQARIVEVGPRDGLQNEKEFVATEDKIQLIKMLAQTGLTHIEATSFVNPKWIPQLADAVEVISKLPVQEGIQYSALVPNLTGFQRAMETGIKEIAVFMSASETHNKKNINKSMEETFPVLREVTEAATAQGIRVRGYVSTVFSCPYEGEIATESVVRVIEELLQMGIYEVSLGDTIGAATPKQVKEKLKVLLRHVPVERLAGHFHDTRGTGLANVYASLEAGVRVFDSSIGGLGGCPYAPGSSGNVSTEDLVYMLEGMGVSTGVKLSEIVKAGAFIQEKLGKILPSKVLAAMLSSCK